MLMDEREQRCDHCWRMCMAKLTHFPQRPSPYNQPFYTLLYFSEPFFGGGGHKACTADCFSKLGPYRCDKSDLGSEEKETNIDR